MFELPHRLTESTKSTSTNRPVRVMTHAEFAARHPNPLHPFIDRYHEDDIDRQHRPDIDRHDTSDIDRRTTIKQRLQLPKIDVAQLYALRSRPKPTENPPEEAEDTSEPMEIEKESSQKTLRKRKEKVPKHHKREANAKELENFKKRVLRIPAERPFEEAYFTHRLWMFFRETRVTEADIEKMFSQIREDMQKKKKSDPGEFIISCMVQGIEFSHALCDTGPLVSILPKVMADQLGLKVEPSKESFYFVDCSRRNSL
ncbi:hypothetical protein Bca4012_062339 [Brassica carinata]